MEWPRWGMLDLSPSPGSAPPRALFSCDLAGVPTGCDDEHPPARARLAFFSSPQEGEEGLGLVTQKATGNFPPRVGAVRVTTARGMRPDQALRFFDRMAEEIRRDEVELEAAVLCRVLDDPGRWVGITLHRGGEDEEGPSHEGEHAPEALTTWMFRCITA